MWLTRRLQKEGGHEVSARREQRSDPRCLSGLVEGGRRQTEAWIRYFSEIRNGQECVIGWTPGVGLETKVAGVDKPAINDKGLAAAIFGIWLGDKPIQGCEEGSGRAQRASAQVGLGLVGSPTSVVDGKVMLYFFGHFT
jgi:Chalcone isomerase-like